MVEEEQELELLAFLYEEGLISDFLKWQKDFKKLPRNQQTATFTHALNRLNWWRCNDKLKK